jgi:hypothetical protein
MTSGACREVLLGIRTKATTQLRLVVELIKSHGGRCRNAAMSFAMPLPPSILYLIEVVRANTLQ